MIKYTLGSARLAHGESVTFTLIVSEPGVVAGLYPEEGSRVECAGQLGPEMRCAVYYELTAHWNVWSGLKITEEMLPFTVTVTVSLRAWYGEYYPDLQGQPCPGYSMWIYSELYYETAPPAPVTHTLTVSVNNPDMGTTDSQYPPGSYTLPAGTAVTVAALPREGYRFDYWLLDGVARTDNPISFTVDRDYRLTACFSEVTVPPPTPPPAAPTPVAAPEWLPAAVWVGLPIAFAVFMALRERGRR
jgi:hypothetical protein